MFQDLMQTYGIGLKAGVLSCLNVGYENKLEHLTQS